MKDKQEKSKKGNERTSLFARGYSETAQGSRVDDELERIGKILYKLRFVLLALFIIICGAFLTARYFINYSFVRDYEKGIYSMEREKILLHADYPESYLTEYNLGCGYYNEGDYDSAMAYFQKSLDDHPYHNRLLYRECDVRVNLALSMLHKIDWDGLDSQEKLDEAIVGLKVIRAVLTSNGCACEPVGKYYGHSQTAEYLKAEIDNVLNQMQNLDDQNSNGGGSGDEDDNNESSDSDSGEDKKETEREKNIRKRLEKEKGESRKEMTENGGNGSGGYGNYGDEGGGNGKNW